MSDIVLSAGVRSNLLQLQQTSDLITQTQTRLATGKRVNSALDNPINFFTAQGLSVRANDLNALLDAMSSGINTIQAANNGITAITKLVQSAQALTSQAQQTADTTVRAALASQFDALLPQIDQLAADAGFNGINLLGGNDLTITMNARRHFECGRHLLQRYHRRRPGDLSARRITGQPPLILPPPATNLKTALTTLRSQAQSLSSNLSTVQIRQDFTKAMINTLTFRRRQSHACRQQRRRRQLARLADPAAAVDHRAVAGLASRSKRAAAVPIGAFT